MVSFWRIFSRACLTAIVSLGLLSCSAEQRSGESAHSVIQPKVAAHLGKAQQLLQNGVLRLALAYTDSAAAIDGDVADIYFVRGRIYTKLSLYDKARSAYQQALSLNPDYEGAWFNIGNTYFRSGRFRKALSQYRKEGKKFARPGLYVHIGQAYNHLGAADSAISAYRKALAIDSSYAPAYAWLGQLYKERGAVREALDYTERALALDSTNLKYRYFAGNLLLSTYQPNAAAAHLERVVQNQPWHYAAHYNLGQAYARVDRQRQAEKHLAKADTLQQQEDEIEQLRGMIQEQPNQPRRWVDLGRALQETGRLTAAKKAYRTALSFKPGNVAIQNDLANIATLLGDTSEAIRRYNAILQQNPGSADVWLNLGVVYANSGRYEEARDAWNKALHYDPEHSRAEAYLEKLSTMRPEP